MVIGGGVAGLASAVWLADFGHDVTVVERQDHPGGQLTMPVPTPMTLTLPAALRDLFGKTGRRLDREFTLIPADPAVRYVTSRGAVTFPHASRSGTLAALNDAFGHETADQWGRLMRIAGDIWQILRPTFVERAATPHTIASLALGTRSRRTAFATLADVFHRANVTDPTVREIIAAHAYAVGVDPERGPAAVVTRPYLEQTFGLWRIDGGPVRLIDALVRRATERGALISTGVTATHVELARRRVVAVHTDDGARHGADAIVSAVPAAGHHRLLGRGRHPSSQFTISSARYPAAGLHDLDAPVRTIVTPRNDTPLGTVDVDSDGSTVVHVAVDRSTARHSEEDATTPLHELTALVAREPAGTVAELVASGIRPEVYGPQQWATSLALGNGSPHGPPATGRWGLARLPRPQSSIHGLYRAGVAAQPGAGIDAAILSAAVIADLISRPQ